MKTSEESKLEAICIKIGLANQYNNLYENPAQKEVYAVNANLSTGAIKELLKYMPNETIIKLVEAKDENEKTKMVVSNAYRLAGERLKKINHISEENLEAKIFELRTKRNCKSKAKNYTYTLPKMFATPQQIKEQLEEQIESNPPEEDIED